MATKMEVQDVIREADRALGRGDYYAVEGQSFGALMDVVEESRPEDEPVFPLWFTVLVWTVVSTWVTAAAVLILATMSGAWTRAAGVVGLGLAVLLFSLLVAILRESRN